MNEHIIKPIANIYNDFATKFAIPRQSGQLSTIKSEIVFEKEFRIGDSLRGIEGFSHLWLIWGFSEVPEGKWSPTVRPPKLGGNKRVGVFATRSPYRPNALGLSSVKLEEIKKSPQNGICLVVSGADILNGTPIYDIKPYLPYTDIHSDATGGFTDELNLTLLDVVIPDDIMSAIGTTEANEIINILSHDPRPSYHNDPDRIYGFPFGSMEIRFKVDNKLLTVVGIEKI